MEYNICNNDKKIFLVCDEVSIKEDNESYQLDFSLKEGCSFYIDLCGLKVRLENEELVIYDEECIYFYIESPKVINNVGTNNGTFDVNVEGDKLHFVLRCENDEFNICKTIIRKNGYQVKENIIVEETNKDLVYDIKTKEIIVRKKVSRFIEKLINHLGLNINYQLYKEIIYREKACENEMEVEVKNIYDSFVYLISDYNNELLEYRLRRFLYLILGEKVNEEIINEIVNLSFTLRKKDVIESSSKVFIKSLNLFNEYGEVKSKLISFSLLQYELLKKGIPISVIYTRDYNLFKEININNEEEVKGFIKGIISKNTYQDKKYYKELNEIEFNEVKEEIIKDKELLTHNHKINHISVFGSFSKNKERIDSDIDLLVNFSLDATSDEINNSIAFIKERYKEKFHRFIDVMEIKMHLTDEVRLETQYAKEVF